MMFGIEKVTKYEVVCGDIDLQVVTCMQYTVMVKKSTYSTIKATNHSTRLMIT